MVSTSPPSVEMPPTTTAPSPTAPPVAQRTARIFAYLADSLVLLAFILVFFVLGGLELLVADRRSGGDPPDAAFYAFIAIFLGGSLLAWSVFNIALTRWRRQTTGMYVLGIQIVTADGAAFDLRRAVVRWFALSPLLFHPLLLPIWGILSLLVVSLTVSQAALVITVGLALLCLVAPAANAALFWFDPARRALHDRAAGTLVVHMPQP